MDVMEDCALCRTIGVQQSMSSQILEKLEKKIKQSFKIFRKHVKPQSKVIIAYSGGKDSTALTLLFLQMVAS